jgi:hypothetical protein
VGCTTHEIAVAVLRHPFGTRQVARPNAPRTLGFAHGIDAQHDARHLVPIRTFGLSIEKTEISSQVLPVITGQNVGVGSLVCNRWLRRSLGHIVRAPAQQPNESRPGERRP